MYVRCSERVRYSLTEPLLAFKDGGRAYFDTFYNGVTVAAWQGACTIHDLSLQLRGSGKFLLRLGLHCFGYPHRWLDEREISLEVGQNLTVALPFWPDLKQGMLYFCCEALGDATLQGGCFATATAPARQVRLGLVITHFRRKQFVLPALRRIGENFRAHGANTGENIKIVIVDNSQDITVAEAAGATLIPNRNLGGSGGFMRGLLYLKDNDFTHCLFMDDDASCEIESILRCYQVLQYANSERLAVAGSLLRELEPHRLYEKGARFDGICRPLKSGLDMRHVEALLVAERVDEAIDYGGWWFFGFKISAASSYAFPFFVRGDDIQFSKLNKFAIFTMNGISCWGEDFSLKNNPLTAYLDVRNHMLQNLCLLDADTIPVVRMLCRFFFFAGFSYNYATARAVTLALHDVMVGPDFWLRNLDMQNKRAEIQSFAAAEKMCPIDRRSVSKLCYLPEYEPRLRRMIRILTLNGFLLPGFLLFNRTVFQHKGFAGSLRNVFRSRRVLYEHEPSQTGYISQHDKSQFFRAMFGFCRELTRFLMRAGRLRTAYCEQLPNMTSESFWRGIYAAEPAPAPLPPRTVSAALTLEDSEAG